MSEPGTSTSSEQPTTSEDWQIEYMNPFPPELQEINEELSDEEDEEEEESDDDRPGSMSPDTLENWKLLPPDDQFDLSMCSSDSKKKVRSLNLGVTRIQFNEGHLTVCVANRGFDNDETRIEMELVQKQGLPSKFRQITNFFRNKIWKKFLVRQINGVDYELQKIHHNDFRIDYTYDGFTYRVVNFRKEFRIFTHDTPSTYKNLFRHHFYIFPNPAPLFYMDLRGIQPPDSEVAAKMISIYEQCRKCECLAIAIRSDEFVEQAHKILEMMADLKNLNIDISLSETEFFSPRLCQIDHLNVTYNKNRISETNLLSLDCQTIKFWSVTITATALNAFIKKWLDSKNSKFKFLEIPIMTLDPCDANPRRILMDLDYQEFDEMRRAAFYKPYDWNFEYNCTGKYRHINCLKGVDVKRKDGKIATIVFSTSFFYFLVWHDRFPEQPENHLPFCDA
ncbi:unnamed protein product [Caenorhabditis nigoni]